MLKIEPTEGRIVWYYAGPKDRRQAAIIEEARATYPGMANRIGVGLYVFGRYHSGYVWVPEILDPDQPIPGYGYNGYATWMPYQKGQAAKAEALEVIADSLRRT